MRRSTHSKILWLACGVPLCVFFLYVNALRLREQPGLVHDFIQEWSSARNLIAGHPLYEDLESSVPRHLGRGYVGEIEVNAHPPGAVLLSVPFAVLPYRAAFLAWTTASMAALAISLWLILSPTGVRGFDRWSTIPVALLLLSSNALAQHLNQGQLTAFLLLAIAVAWRLHRGECYFGAGVALGLAAAIKLFPAFLVLVFVPARRWRGLAGAAAGFSLLTLPLLLAAGTAPFLDYAQVVPRLARFQGYWLNASIPGFFAKLLDPTSGHSEPVADLPGLARVLAIVVSLAIAIPIVRADGLLSRERSDALFSYALTAMLLVSPITWDHSFLLLALPLAWLWQRAPDEPTSSRLRQRALILVLIVVLGIHYPRWIWDVVMPGPGEMPRAAGAEPTVASPLESLTWLSYQFYALLALLAWTAAGLRRGLGSSSAAPSREKIVPP